MSSLLHIDCFIASIRDPKKENILTITAFCPKNSATTNMNTSKAAQVKCTEKK
uniref:Uncharacterized protein n=1 Tax=Rhizophora mucronata TaxID=61149 RepID=A0A2P2QMQ2_RHIMU